MGDKLEDSRTAAPAGGRVYSVQEELEGFVFEEDAQRAPLELDCGNCEFVEDCRESTFSEDAGDCPRFREVYSRARTERFAADVLALGAYRVLEVVLSILTVDSNRSAPYRVELGSIAIRWARLSPWGKANALFLLAPALERIVAGRARELAAEAREAEGGIK